MIILATSSPGEIRALAVDERGAVDTAIERPGGPLEVGDRVIGRITSRVPAMAGAFVALPGSPVEGFLPDTAGSADRSEGRLLALSVTRGSQGGKGPRLTALPDPVEGPVRLLTRGPGAIERLARLHPDATIQVDRPIVAATLPPDLRHRVTVGLDDRADQIASLWAMLEESTVALPGGARMTITPTPALVAIDIDAAAATAERRPKKAAQLALNRGLAAEVARQIRLRHLAGAIVIDPAGLALRDRPKLAEAFQTALAEDPMQPRFLGFSALGLAEILRPRRYPPLHDLLVTPHAEALAALAALCNAWESRPSSTDALMLGPDLLGALEADMVALAQFRDRTGRLPTLYTEGADITRRQRWRLVTNLQR